MREVRDTTGRFGLRPHYQPAELDRLCEALLAQFFKPIHGDIPIPILTDDLTRLIERDVSDFDPGADLSEFGIDVEGVTEFAPARKPRVRIAAELAYDERRENRYRTTLTHEYGHVHFHGYLFALQSASADLLQQARPAVQVCKRETIIDARNSDWMEWQAGYVSGALLMPISFIRKVVGIFHEERGMFGPAASGTAEAAALIERIRSTFQVSADAARVRLTKLGFLATQARGLSLFSSSMTTI
jgi:IrrE N-terminal-like domain